MNFEVKKDKFYCDGRETKIISGAVHLYVPASLLKKGENDILLFESDGIKSEPEEEFSDFYELV